MKRTVLTAALAVALLVPAAVIAQSPDPAASPGPMTSPGAAESQAPLGVDTMDVCLSISGPVVLMTAESLTQGIIDGTFVINGLSEACGPSAMASPAAPMASPAAAMSSPAAPMASPAASPEA